MTFTTEEPDPKRTGVDLVAEATAEAAAGATTDTAHGDVGDNHERREDDDLTDGAVPDPDLAQGEKD